ncbi:CIC family chloride channel protein [Haloferula luteola]|uniref:CIC family chloride channel protein n=1 Tax=Haloferula luteola TaxID=595692 RepID=A0A840V6Z9_9BACT|nr:chloride channel protein [Haloferula luteola]MBB5353752.1 CIC family chloride channel protein [Haloferula luteola]
MNEEKPRYSLPDWMRKKLSDEQRFLFLCVLGGLLCGLAAVAFHFAIHHMFEGLWSLAKSQSTVGFVAIMLGAPTLAGLLVGIGVQYFSPNSAGSGIPQTKEAYYNKGGKISGWTGIWRFILGSLYVGLGNSLGREGPTVHISTAITSRIGRWAFRDPTRVQSMAPVGMAAGIAAAFNAPLSALTFVFEELLDNFSMKALGGMVVAVVVAAAVSRSLLGEDPVITAKLAEDYHTSWWMLVALPLGVASGLIGHGFVRGILGIREWFKERRFLPPWMRPAVGGLSCGILGIAAYFLTQNMGNARSSIFSIGYDSLVAAFDNQLTVGILLVLLVMKFFAVVLNYATGGSGGLFSPTLFLGGMLGALIGVGLSDLQHFGQWIPMFPSDAKVIGGCVLLGMGAMFAAVVRCPFTSLIIIFEMTGNYSLILPLMAGNMLAWQIAKKLQPVSIYNALLLQDGVTLRRMPAYRGARDYRKLPVKVIMSHEPFIIRAEEPTVEATKRIQAEAKRFHAYPVLDGEDQLRGVITLHELEENPEVDRVEALMGEQKLISVTIDTPIRDAANRMIARDIQQVPVVSATDAQKLLGWLTLNDIARQQNASEEV